MKHESVDVTKERIGGVASGSSVMVSDLVLAALGLAIALGWLALPPFGERNVALGLLGIALYVVEHLAFAHAMRSSLRRFAMSPRGLLDGAAIARQLPPAGLTILYGTLMRVVMRFILLAQSWQALGILQIDEHSGVALVPFVALILFDLIFAGYWLLPILGPETATGRTSGASKDRAQHDWLSRQVQRAGTSAHQQSDLVFRIVLLLWTCGLYAFLWPAMTEPITRSVATTGPDESRLGLGLLLLLVLLVFTVLIHIPLHFDAWLERRIYARTRAARWRLRGAALLAATAGYLPTLSAYWHLCRR